MKNTLFLTAALSLAGLAAAQPSGHRHHEHLHNKRQVVVYETDIVTASGPDVVVYVNDDGTPMYTSTVGGAASTSAAAASTATSATSAAAVTTVDDKHKSYDHTSTAAASTSTAAITTTAAASTTTAASTTESVATSSTSSSASSSSSSASTSGYVGIAYSPYSGSYADGNVGCKTAAEVTADFALIPDDYNLVRIYGTDCNQVENVLAAAKSKGMKLFAGVYDITEVTSEIEIIIAAADGDWSDFHTVSIGNELINDGDATVDAVVSAIATARTLLTAASYTGYVVTVDTSGAIEDNIELCEASDYVAANAHPFFDADTTANEAGAWVISTMEAVSEACGGKDTMITETGWPWGGESNGDAVPSVANQALAVETIKGNVTSNIIYFTAFNDLWKAAGYLEVEQSWGLYGTSAAS